MFVDVEGMGDERHRCSTQLPHGGENGGVAAADEVIGSDIGVLVEALVTARASTRALTDDGDHRRSHAHHR